MIFLLMLFRPAQRPAPTWEQIERARELYREFVRDNLFKQEIDG